MYKMPEHHVYTDGSCLGNPGPGGWAVICSEFRASGGLPHTTNNVMEMTAVVKALEMCLEKGILDIKLVTDSMYVKDGITSWMKNWKKNDWRKADGQPVKNKDLWMQIDTLSQQMNRVEWMWVRAHNGHPQNEEVDRLAYQEAMRIKSERNV
ncbi:hypothetical protein [Dishui Lake phycodnavirus 3]|nr:hypothetical protein [Dishui Lake phycodnavirus 3]